VIRNFGFAVQMIAVAIMTPFLSASVSARNRDQQSGSLKDQFAKKYELAEVARGAASLKVTKPGTVFVIQQDGIVGVTGLTDKTCPAKFENEALHKPSGLCLEGLRLLREFTRDLTTGESVYVSKVDVEEKKGSVSVEIVECDSCNGGKTSSYKSEVVFLFKKGELEAADLSKVTDVIGKVLAVNEPADNKPQPDARAQDPSGGSANLRRTAANDSQRSSPPPSTPAAPAKPIQVGQTFAEVKAVAGDELVLVTDLVTTKIYRYNGQRIKFENGVVTEIQ
jgi:hypothetical protein